MNWLFVVVSITILMIILWFSPRFLFCVPWRRGCEQIAERALTASLFRHTPTSRSAAQQHSAASLQRIELGLTRVARTVLSDVQNCFVISKHICNLMDWKANDLCSLLSLSCGILNRLLDGISFYFFIFFHFFFLQNEIWKGSDVILLWFCYRCRILG